jgi:hypothetical protein
VKIQKENMSPEMDFQPLRIAGLIGVIMREPGSGGVLDSGTDVPQQDTGTPSGPVYTGGTTG